jgi:hypothetical protein
MAITPRSLENIMNGPPNSSNAVLALRGAAFAALGLTHVALTIGYYIGFAALWVTWFVETPYVPCNPGVCTPVPKYWVPPARLFETDAEWYIAMFLLLAMHLLVRLLVYKAHETFPSIYRWVLAKRADAVFGMLDNVVGFLLAGLFLICALFVFLMMLDSCVGYMFLEPECLERSYSWIEHMHHQ